MEDARREWKILRMEYNLSYFHTNSILNFVHGIYKKMYADVWQCRRTGRRGSKGVMPLLTTACAPLYFDLLKIPLMEHHVTARQQTIMMMEKGRITFKQISPSTFLDSLRNSWQPFADTNLTQLSVLLTCLYGCVAEETCSTAKILPVLR